MIFDVILKTYIELGFSCTSMKSKSIIRLTVFYNNNGWQLTPTKYGYIVFIIVYNNNILSAELTKTKQNLRKTIE